jgi:predicted nucleic acid-binding Zn ribbon protein
VALGAVAQAGAATGVSPDFTARHQTLQRLGHSASLASAQRSISHRSAKLERVTVAGPAPFAALPQLAASALENTGNRQLPRRAAAGPCNGRSPPRFL